MIKLEKDICSDFSASTRREWLETNGIGGFASSTVANINARRYHGLLVAATDPPLGRMVLLSKFEEVLTVGDRRYELSANQFPGTINPRGFEYLTDFRLDPFPVWTYETDTVTVVRKLFMPHGENTVVCTWEAISKNGGHGPVSLEVRPLLAFRDYHHLRSEDPEFKGSFEAVGSTVSVKPVETSPTLFFSANGAKIEGTGHWYRSFEYEAERQRGFDFREDLFQPFSAVFDLSKKAEIVVSTIERKAKDAAGLEKAELARRAKLVAAAKAKDDLSRQLVLAADQFIVERGKGHTVIAGYPWFSDWGRDTMISLPGLTLATGRPEIARQILLEFSGHISEGMLPNRFPDAGEVPEYNTVDATLWYFEAARAYAEATGDLDFVRKKLYEKLAGIVDRHVEGTRYGIRVDSDGLLRAGEEGVQLTWMDAKIEDWVVTPRIGKPVEIQALWYNALRTMEGFAREFDDKEGEVKYAGLGKQTSKGFRDKFWNADEGCLYDVVSDEWSDGRVRPNQIFAVSLQHSMLTKERAVKVVGKVREHLLTPFGLRSLSPGDREYRPRYEGGPVERDAAYHQGTVWAWLLGPYVDAYRKVMPKTAKTEKAVAGILSGIEAHLCDSGLGQISEIFDADHPHEPRGCFAQAWSVAEIFRAINSK